MVRRPPPRRRKSRPRIEEKPRHEPKTVIVFSRKQAAEMIQLLEDMRDNMPMDERADWDDRPFGVLLRTMTGRL